MTAPLLPPCFVHDTASGEHHLRSRGKIVARVIATDDGEEEEDARELGVVHGSLRAVLDRLAHGAFMRAPHRAWLRPFNPAVNAYFHNAPPARMRTCLLWAPRAVWEPEAAAGVLPAGGRGALQISEGVVALLRVTPSGDACCLLCASALPPPSRRLVDSTLPDVGFVASGALDIEGGQRTRVIVERLPHTREARIHFWPPLFRLATGVMDVPYDELTVALGPSAVRPASAVMYAYLKYAAVGRRVMNQGRDLWFYPPRDPAGVNADALWGLDLAYEGAGSEGPSLLGRALRVFVDALRAREAAAARRIQRAWRSAIADPGRALCHKRLMRECEELRAP